MSLLKLVSLLIMLSTTSIQAAFAELANTTSSKTLPPDTLPTDIQSPTLQASPEILNADNIERWLQSQQAFEAWGEEHSERLESASEQTTEPKNPMDMTVESLIAPLKSANLYASANQFTKNYGFYNLESWASITLRITKAAAAIEFESHPEMMDTSRLEALKSAPEINEQQKTRLIQAIERNRLIVKQVISGTSSADKNAVKPFLNRIHQLMEAPR